MSRSFKLFAVTVLVVVMFAMLLVVPGPVHAVNGIVLDYAFEIDNAGGSPPFGNPTWSHTVGSGSNRILLVGVTYGVPAFQAYLPAIPVAYGSGSAGYGPAAYRPANMINPITSVVFGSSPLTLLVGTSSSFSQLGAIGVQVYQLLNPPVGTATITVTFVSPMSWGLAGSASFFNVMGIGNTAFANDNGGTVTDMQVTVSANSGDVVLDLLATQLGSDVTPGPGQTLFSDGWTLQLFPFFVVAGSYKPASSPVTMTWTPSGTVFGSAWAHVALALQPTTTPTTGGAPVGGFVVPVNKLSVFAPYLLLGLAVLAIVVAAPWKKREN